MRSARRHRNDRRYRAVVSHDAEQAERSLRELRTLTGRTRLASRSMVTGFPLIGWGFAYVVGLAAIDLLDGSARVVVAGLAYAVAMALSWLPIRHSIRTGVESRMRAAWWVVMVGTPVLVAAAHPHSFAHAMLMASAVWGLAMCLYGVTTDDRAFAIVAGSGTVWAALLAVVDDLPHSLLWFGLGAGLPLGVLGAVRVLQGGRNG